MNAGPNPPLYKSFAFASDYDLDYHDDHDKDSSCLCLLCMCVCEKRGEIGLTPFVLHTHTHSLSGLVRNPASDLPDNQLIISPPSDPFL